MHLLHSLEISLQKMLQNNFSVIRYESVDYSDVAVGTVGVEDREQKAQKLDSAYHRREEKSVQLEKSRFVGNLCRVVQASSSEIFCKIFPPFLTCALKSAICILSSRNMVGFRLGNSLNF